VRSPTQAEITAIRFALSEDIDGDMVLPEWEPDWNNVGIIDSYMSDGPGWCGKAAIFPGGEINFVNVALFTRNGEAVHCIWTAEAE